jgi:hypothetical protein
MQHGEEPDLGPEVLRVGGDPAERLGGGVEEEMVHDPLVLQGDRAESVRHGEDDVEVLH